MAPPPVTIYITSLTSQPKVRRHIELLHRSLRGLDIPYEAFDLVNEPEAKIRWQRSKPPGMVVGLPGYLVGGEWVGTMDEFEEAVETATLPQFLKQDIDLPDIPNISTESGTGDDDGETVGNASQTIQEFELEKLMREMSDADLDALVSELSVDDAGKVGKVGLLVTPNESVQEVVKGESDERGKVKEQGQETGGGIVAAVSESVGGVAGSVGEAVVSITTTVAGLSEDDAQAQEGGKKVDVDGARASTAEAVESQKSGNAVETIAQTEKTEGKEKVD